MSTKIGEVFINIGAVLDDMNRGFQKAQGLTAQFEKKTTSIFSGLGSKIAAIVSVAAVAKFFIDATKAASDATETNQKFSVTFDSVIQKADEAAKTLAQGYGLARTEAKSMLAATGDLLTGLGMQKDVALDLSIQTQQLAVDLASFSNFSGGAKGASEALTAAMLGERERMKALGVIITEEMVKAELVAAGKAKLTGLALQQAKAQATLNIAIKQSQNAMGDFARSMDSPANVMRRVLAQFQDFKEDVGARIAPALGRLGSAFLNASKNGGVLQDVVKKISDLIGNLIDGITVTVNWLQGRKLDKEIEMAGISAERAAAKYRELKNELLALKAAGAGKQEIEWKQDEINRQREGYEKFNETIQRQTQDLANLRKENEKIKSGRGTEFAAVSGGSNVKKPAVSAEAAAGAEVAAEMKKNASKWKEISESYGLNALQLEEERYKKELSALEEANAKKLLSQEQYINASKSLSEQHAENNLQLSLKQAGKSIGMFDTALSGISEILSMVNESESIAIDNKLVKDMEAVDKWYQAQRENIIRTVSDRESRDKQLDSLDKEKTRKEVDAQKKADKEKRKLQRKAAEETKTIKMFEIVVNTASAVVGALASMPGIGGIILAAIIGALGIAQLAVVSAQPLPVAAEGIYAESPYIGGEAGPELAFPLSSARGKAAIALMADGLLNAMAEKTSGTIGTISETVRQTSQTIKGDVILYGEKIGEFISAGTSNGQILIASRSVV